MVFSKKKQIVLFSDGSVLQSKTLMKTMHKIKILNKDHLTFMPNKKQVVYDSSASRFKSFKNKFTKV